MSVHLPLIFIVSQGYFNIAHIFTQKFAFALNNILKLNGGERGGYYLNKKNKVKQCCFFTIIILALVCFNNQIMHLVNLPLQKKIIVGESLDLGFNADGKLAKYLQVDVKTNNSANLNFPITDSAPVITTPGKIDMYVKLFGIIPLRQITVDVVPEVKVMPGGQSIGVMLHSQGVMVVGLSTVTDSQGKSHNPADQAGIKVGDILIKINDVVVESEEQVRDIITQAGSNNKSVTLEIEREGKKIIKEIKPIYCPETKRYRLGLFVRDSAAGVGTLSFYDPTTLAYGALGHVITDSDTGKKINLSDGRIVEASIQKIHRGMEGQPGEKVGMLENNSILTGTISQNNAFGIYGKLTQKIDHPLFDEPVPVALASRVKEGPAEIITVIEGNKPEKFKINIEKVSHQSHPDSKSMVIKITDPKLIKATGGIVQGMSGSPIIQYRENGQPVLVGAVTHVFLQDCTKGYGIMAEWMIRQAGIKSQKRTPNKGRSFFIPALFNIIINHNMTKKEDIIIQIAKINLNLMRLLIMK